MTADRSPEYYLHKYRIFYTLAFATPIVVVGVIAGLISAGCPDDVSTTTKIIRFATGFLASGCTFGLLLGVISVIGAAVLVSVLEGLQGKS